MTVVHHVIAHAPGSICGATLFVDTRNNAATVVFTDLKDNTGEPVVSHLGSAVSRTRKAFLGKVPADRIAWLYRRGDSQTFYSLEFEGSANGEPVLAQEPCGLESVVHRFGGFVRRVFVPEFRPAGGMMRARQERNLFCYASPG